MVGVDQRGSELVGGEAVGSVAEEVDDAASEVAAGRLEALGRRCRVSPLATLHPGGLLLGEYIIDYRPGDAPGSQRADVAVSNPGTADQGPKFDQRLVFQLYPSLDGTLLAANCSISRGVTAS